jgi:transcription antitermination factor NusG
MTMVTATPCCHVQKDGLRLLPQFPTKVDLAAVPASATFSLYAGMAVSIRAGPFAGMEGRVADGGDRKHVIVTVQALQRPVDLEIQRSLLEVLPTADTTFERF